MPEGEAPPDICVEIALWDRFPGWGPDQTDKFTLTRIRLLFAVLEQQRVTKHANEEMGRPSQGKLDSIMEAEKIKKMKQAEQAQSKAMTPQQERAERHKKLMESMEQK